MDYEESKAHPVHQELQDEMGELVYQAREAPLVLLGYKALQVWWDHKG